MTHKCPVYGHKPHAFDLTLREKKTVERVLRGGLINEIFDHVTMVDDEKFASERLEKAWKIFDGPIERELSEPVFDRDFPNAGGTGDLIVTGRIQELIDRVAVP